MIVAITGGIGSGKSYVSRLLAQKGIQVYDCDAAAKRLMRTSRVLQQRLSSLVGTELFPDGQLQKPLLRRFLLQDGRNARAIDDIVHPAVAADFLHSGAEWIESAILFDSHFDERIHPDHVVCVTAPITTRIQRVISRDHITREKAQEWINRQLPQETLLDRSDFEIVNDGRLPLGPQLDKVLKAIQSRKIQLNK